MKRADGAIDRSEACDTPSVPMAITGRCLVGNTHRGNHLGQRSRATAPKGRTYGSKRSDQIFRSALARGSRPHMELAANPAARRSSRITVLRPRLPLLFKNESVPLLFLAEPLGCVKAIGSVTAKSIIGRLRNGRFRSRRWDSCHLPLH